MKCPHCGGSIEIQNKAVKTKEAKAVEVKMPKAKKKGKYDGAK